MKHRKKSSKRMLSVFSLSAMLVSTVLPQSLTLVHADEQKQVSPSNGTFNADEVNKILSALTAEQKANINHLTGADNTQKIHVKPKDLRSAKNMNVIVQFKTDPAKIQIIKQSLAKGGATANSQAFASEYADAQNKVKDAHAKFKSFVKTNQPKSQITGGETVHANIEITREYTDAFNGVALSIPANQIEKIAEFAEVASVWPVVEVTAEQGSDGQATETTGAGKPTAGLSLMGVDKLQAEGNTGIIKSGPRAGQKIKVGVLDTGIDYNHPDLKAVYKGGHDFINHTVDGDGNVTYVDDLDPMETTYTDWLKDKEHPSPIDGEPPSNYKKYITSHGTHVSGTIAANTTNNNDTYSANGVAPDVELYGYRVLGPGGHGNSGSVLGGIEQSVRDHMDVINLSLGAGINDPLYPTSIAINNATLSGVVCAVAAGNAGPGQATVGSPGTSALAITVGATTIPEDIATMTLKYGQNTYKARLFGKNFAQSDDAYKGQSIPIVDVGLGSEQDYEGLDLTGKIALVKRGVDYLNVKMTNAKNSGAIGMIIWNNQSEEDNDGFISSNLGTTMDNIYAVSMTQADGQALSDAVKANPTTAKITYPLTNDAPVQKKADELANFSSTGPVKDWNIKPDIVAPGVDILSTAPYDIWEPQSSGTPDYHLAYQLMSGTSMATPHVAGIIALVMAAHPDYTPADVKTSLMNTAKDINTDSKTYSVYQVGAGRVDPVRAVKSNVKIQVLDKANTIESSNGVDTITQIDNITGSMFFGFKGRGEGATNGSDDVVQSKDFNVINDGASSKTFNVSSTFLSTKFAASNPVGSGTGNDVKIEISTGGSKVNSINVGGGNTVKATAKITVPANAIDGTYEGYINLVNANDPSETYRIPFTITVAEKGIDFKVNIKAFNPGERYTGNYNPAANIDISAYTFSVNSAMDSMYIVIKDQEGRYIGVAQNVAAIGGAGPGVQYGPYYILASGKYLPFKKPYNGSIDQSGIDTTPAVLKEGAYSLEMIATDADGKQYRAEDTVYVDYSAPTMTMDADSKPGIYEIDPTGYLPGQEIKGFYGKVYDSNVDLMKQNGETSVPRLDDINKSAPVDQSLNVVFGYVDAWLNMTFKPNEQGRFHFGITPEDITPEGKNFWIYPSDYAASGDVNTTSQMYHFIKKGSPYLTYEASGGVDSTLENEGKVVVEPNKPFKTTIKTKNAVGMTGAHITLNNSNVYSFSNIKLTDEYKQYLESKGITPTYNVGEAYNDSSQGGQSIDITIAGISENGALTKDMNIIEADTAYTNPNPIIGPAGYFITKSSFDYAGTEKEIPAFQENYPWVKQSTSQITAGLFAESFLANNLGGSFTNIVRETGGKVTVRDSKNNVVAETDKPTSTEQNSIQPFLQYTSGTYATTVPVSDDPYQVEVYMPGHFKDYYTSPVIGSTKYGYRSGSFWDRPSYETPKLLGGDVNGDNVIDMKDLTTEVQSFVDLTFLKSPFVGASSLEKANFFTQSEEHRNTDISWAISGQTPLGTRFSSIDYNDFYYIFKNFGKVNESAVEAGKEVPTPQLNLTQDLTITSDRGTRTDAAYDPAVKTITLKAGDGMEQVRAALNFAGPTQQTTVAQLPTLTELKNGSSIELVPTSTVFLDDVVWRNAINKIELGLNGVYEDVTNKVIPNTSDKAVTINAGYSYFDPYRGATYVPSKVKLNGSLFGTTGNYTVRISAAGYQPVTRVVSIADIPIQTPDIPTIIDPSKAHVGQDLTVTFTDDAKWREGINKIVVKTQHWSGNIDITNLKDGSNNLYYDITQPGKITFKAGLFKTNANPVSATSPIEPGGTKNLNQNYKIDIYSTGVDGTVYPVKTLGADNYNNGVPVGYGITFDAKGGSPVAPVAFGYKPQNTKVGSGPIGNQVTSVSVFANPTTTRSGYKFLGWYYFDPVQNKEILWDITARYDSDITVFAKWQVDFAQNYSPVDVAKPNGAKFDGTGSNPRGWILGEGNLNISVRDYATTVPWLNANNIDKIEAEYYKVKPDGTTESTSTKYTLDPSTYTLTDNGEGVGTLSFTTATEKYATEHPNEKFAFSAAPSLLKASPYSGYKVTITAKTGEKLDIPDVKLGYRRHIDLNGGTLKSQNDTYFDDKFINGKANVPDMTNALLHVTKDNLSIGPVLYLDSANSKDKASPISSSNGVYLTDNTTFYLGWIKTPPKVQKDTEGNIVGSDITLKFTDDGTWKDNIQKVSIGSKELVRGTDYTLTNNAITLNHALFVVGQKVNITIKSEGYVDTIVTDQVIGHLVTFESNGGDSVASQIVDTRVTKPVDPTKVGFKFMGWYTNEALTTPYDFSSIVTEAKTLYAKYALTTSIVSADTKDNALGNDMTLEFSDKNWAKAITRIQIGGVTVDAAKIKVNPTEGTITLDHSLFTKVGDFSITVSATEYADVTVTQKVVNGYTIHFVLPGDAPTELKDAVKDQIVTRRITEPVAHGYDLTWFTDEERTIPWDFTSSIYSGKTLYGKWKLAKYTVIYNTQDAGLVVSVKAEYNSLLDESKPTRTGYTFLGWYKDAEGTKAWNFATDKVTADTVLYAKWSINNYSVKFDSQGGSSVAAITANYDTTIAKPSSPTRSGYVFLGWYKDVAGTKAWDFATDKVTSNTTIYAKWAAIPATPKANAVATNYNTIKVSWAAVTGASGYEISRSSSKTGPFTVISTTTNTAYNNTGLATGSTYYYKVRSYKLVNGVKVYSGYSTIVSAKPVPSTPINVKAAKVSSTSVKLTWSSVSGANGYQVYRSTSNTGTFTLVKNTTTPYLTNTGLVKGKTYYYKVRSYRMVGKTVVYSGWSTVVVAK